MSHTMGRPIRASQTEAGKKYLRRTPSGKIVPVKCKEHKGDKVILEVSDPDFDDEITVPAHFMLHELEDAKPAPAPKAKPAPKPIAKKPEPKPAKEPKTPKPKKVKKERMAKVPDGKAAPRVELEGFTLRQHYRNRLAINRAQECEKAKEHVCRCRCGGALHGKPHKPWMEAEEVLFQASPVSAITAKDVLSLIKKFGGAKFIAERKNAQKQKEAAQK